MAELHISTNDLNEMIARQEARIDGNGMLVVNSRRFHPKRPTIDGWRYERSDGLRLAVPLLIYRRAGIAAIDAAKHKVSQMLKNPEAEARKERQEALDEQIRLAKGTVGAASHRLQQSYESLRVWSKLSPNSVESCRATIDRNKEELRKAKEQLQRLEEEKTIVQAPGKRGNDVARKNDQHGLYRSTTGHPAERMLEEMMEQHYDAKSQGVLSAWMDARKQAIETTIEGRVLNQAKRRLANYIEAKKMVLETIKIDTSIEEQKRLLEDAGNSSTQIRYMGRAVPDPLRGLPAPAAAISAPLDSGLVQNLAMTLVLMAGEDGWLADDATWMNGLMQIGNDLGAPGAPKEAVIAMANQIRQRALSG